MALSINNLKGAKIPTLKEVLDNKPSLDISKPTNAAPKIPKFTQTPKQKESVMGMMGDLKKSYDSMQSAFPEQPWEESNIENFDADRHLADLKALEQSLVEDVPGLPVLMSRVMRNLREYPDLAHLLNEEQINCIVRAFSKRKVIEIVTPTKTAGKGGKGGVSVANLTKDMTASQILDLL